MTIATFDLSLTATGYARWTSGIDFGTVHPAKGYSGLRRLDYVCREVVELARGADIVLMEDVAFSKNKAYAKEIAGLAYLVRHALWKRDQPFLLAQSTSLKKFATGSGKAEKNMVLLSVFRRFEVEATNDNEADAIALLFLGRALVGDWEPTMEAQREVLLGLRNSNADVLDRLGVNA